MAPKKGSGIGDLDEPMKSGVRDRTPTCANTCAACVRRIQILTRRNEKGTESDMPPIPNSSSQNLFKHGPDTIDMHGSSKSFLGRHIGAYIIRLPFSIGVSLVVLQNLAYVRFGSLLPSQIRTAVMLVI